MMKKLLISLSSLLILTSSFSQNDLEVTLTAPTSAGSTFRSTFAQTSIIIKNNGPAILPAGTRINLFLSVNASFFNFKTGTPNQFAVARLNADLAVGDVLPAEQSILLYPPNYPSSAQTNRICSGAFVVGNNDTDSSNNIGCYTWEISTLSNAEITFEETTKVYVAHNFLNMSSTEKENLTYSVVSITGQIVSQGNFTGNKQVDLSSVSKGIYAVIITNGAEKVTKKVVLQ